MRKLLDRAADGDETATVALDVYVHRLAASVAAMAVSLGGLDELAFTGGVGEHAAEAKSLASSVVALAQLQASSSSIRQPSR
jgi:acetate kinase